VKTVVNYLEQKTQNFAQWNVTNHTYFTLKFLLILERIYQKFFLQVVF